MPRIRTIKPEFFTSETVSALPLRARLTWIGLWTHCDDHGRARANVKLLKAAVWPLDNVSLRDIEEDLTALIAQGLIFTYTAEDGKNYLQVSGWAEHQKVDRPSKSPIPAPAGNRSARPAAHAAPSEPVDNPEYEESAQAEAHSRATREDSSSPREALAGERKGKERKGKEGTRAREEPPTPNDLGPEPSLQCEEHIGNPKPPACIGCRDARRIHEQWAAAKAQRARDAPKCRTHWGQPADNCSGCRGDALAAKTGAYPIVKPRSAS